MDGSLFTGRLVRLAALDAEKDAELMAKWSQNSEYLRLSDAWPARPWLAKEAKEQLEKEQANENGFFFLIRTLGDDRAIGYIELDGISWNNGDAWIGISIGEPEDWGKGYGTDAMRVLVRFAFTEANLHRVSLNTFEYNPRAIRSYEKAGFVHEGRRRQFLRRDGRRWDLIFMGLLKTEWEKQSDESQT